MRPLKISAWTLFLAGAMSVIAPTAHANLLVSSFGTNEVIQYNQTTGAFIGSFIAAGAGGLTAPMGLTTNGASIFVASSGTNEVLRYHGTTGALQGSFASGGGLLSPTGMVFGPDGHLYVASRDSNEVKKYNGATGAFIGDFATGAEAPIGVIFGPDGHLYVATGTGGSSAIMKFNGTTGALINDTFSTNADLDQPRGIIFGADGNLYVASGNTQKVIKFNGLTGAYIGDFATSGDFGTNGPFGLQFGEDGNLLAATGADPSSSEVLRFDKTTGAFIDVFVGPIGGNGGLTDPTFMLLSPTPEPSTIAMFVLGGALLAFARRRKR